MSPEVFSQFASAHDSGTIARQSTGCRDGKEVGLNIYGSDDRVFLLSQSTRYPLSMSALPSSTEVLIVGAGPTGLACALGLAARNVPFLLVDALSEGHNSSRAVLMQASSLEALEAIHPSLPASIVAGGIQSATFNAVDVHERPIFTIRMDNALVKKTKYPFCLLVPQHRVEARMREALAQKRRGGEVHWGKRVVDLRERETEDGSVKWDVSFEGGETVQARYVVAADGSKSTIRSLAGIRFLNPYNKTPTEATPGEKDLSFVVADVLLEDPLPAHTPHNAIQIMVGKGGVVLTAPIPAEPTDLSSRNLFRVYLGVPDTPPSKPDSAYLQAILDARGPGSHTTTHPALKIVRVLDSSRYRTRPALAERYVHRASKGGAYVLLAGDSAHKHGPAGGQGMNMGVCDATELADIIADHLSSLSSSSASSLPTDDSKKPHTADAVELFDAYSTRRRAVAKTVIDMVEGMTELERGGDGWDQWFRMNALWLAFKIPFINSTVAWQLSGLGHAVKK
ncbi:FAD/NAD(P)-binding domain-containing protein [Mycena chlorophos]|uniref:FAD/NAD(P)-binding domain-containing protein n=1 Tax=Mycena chlorophos TaxID=658473 RepID=A0A8H6WI62_MYCCL|nr:FAD/NAD(P)-binding domain-containing protein [Mycena chlorophos]